MDGHGRWLVEAGGERNCSKRHHRVLVQQADPGLPSARLTEARMRQSRRARRVRPQRKACGLASPDATRPAQHPPCHHQHDLSFKNCPDLYSCLSSCNATSTASHSRIVLILPGFTFPCEHLQARIHSFFGGQYGLFQSYRYTTMIAQRPGPRERGPERRPASLPVSCRSASALCCRCLEF
jgi:hypothetical protein